MLASDQSDKDDDELNKVKFIVVHYPFKFAFFRGY